MQRISVCPLRLPLHAELAPRVSPTSAEAEDLQYIVSPPPNRRGGQPSNPILQQRRPRTRNADGRSAARCAPSSRDDAESCQTASCTCARIIREGLGRSAACSSRTGGYGITRLLFSAQHTTASAAASIRLRNAEGYLIVSIESFLYPIPQNYNIKQPSHRAQSKNRSILHCNATLHV